MSAREVVTPLGWAAGSYRTAAHALVGPRRTACGTPLGHGLLSYATLRTCRRCEQLVGVRF